MERVEEKRTSPENAAARLGISERQFRRILLIYRLEGEAGLVSRKRGVPSNRMMEESIRVMDGGFIQDLLVKGFGPTLISEKLEEIKEFCLSK